LIKTNNGNSAKKYHFLLATLAYKLFSQLKCSLSMEKVIIVRCFSSYLL